MIFLFYSSTCLPSSGAGEWTSWISSALFNYVKPIYVKTNHFSCNEYLLQIYATFPCSVCTNQAKHRFTRIRIRLLWHSRVGCTLEVAWRKRCAVGWLVKRALNGDATQHTCIVLRILARTEWFQPRHYYAQTASTRMKNCAISTNQHHADQQMSRQIQPINVMASYRFIVISSSQYRKLERKGKVIYYTDQQFMRVFKLESLCTALQDTNTNKLAFKYRITIILHHD